MEGKRPGYLMIKEAAARYDVSRAKLHRLIGLGRLHTVKDRGTGGGLQIQARRGITDGVRDKNRLRARDRTVDR